MVTVGDILKLPLFSNCTVLAGLSGLGRPVRGWNVAEHAEFHLWVKGGEFVMSMLSFVADHESGEEVGAWVRSLIDSGASALGVKRSVYQAQPPQFLLELGDQHGFPIVEMDDDLSLTDAGEKIFSHVIASRERNFKKAMDALSEMASVAVDDWIPGLVRQLSLTLESPVLLETPNMRLAGIAGDHTSREKHILSARREPLCLASIKKNLENSGAFEIFPLWGLRFLRHEFNVNDESFQQLIFPVEISDKVLGYVSVIEAGKEFDHGDLALVRSAIYAISLLALHDGTYSIAEEIRHELLSAMLTPGREKEAEERARLYGFDYLTPAFCVLAQSLDHEERNRLPGEMVITKLVYEMQAVDQESLVIHHGSSIVLFCHVLDGSIARKQKVVRLGYPARLKYILDLFESLKNTPELRIGVGRPGAGISQLRASFEEALTAIRIADRFSLPWADLVWQTPITKYYHILDALLQDEAKAWAFCEDVLGPLLQSNVKHIDEYCNTLEAYLQYGKNLADISRNTGLHRNTVIYRIEKMREVLGVDMNDIQADLSIWLALQIRKFLAPGPGET